jgi:hypothetical protein
MNQTTTTAAAVTSCELIPMPDISTIADRDTWVADSNGRVHTHPGIPGWEIVAKSPTRFQIYGLTDGMTSHIATVAKWDHAITWIAYMHGA